MNNSELEEGYMDELVKEFSPKALKDSLQEKKDYLSICVKYQMFDLEATRRELKLALEENEELRGLIERLIED